MNFGDTRLPARFWDKTIPEPNSGCWLWLGAMAGHSPQIRWKIGADWKVVSAYRVSTMPDDPDAKCDVHRGRCENDRCVNPAHCMISQNANTEIGAVRSKRQTHCVHGHDRGLEGTYLQLTRGGTKSKRCRGCHREAMRERAFDGFLRRLALAPVFERPTVARNHYRMEQAWRVRRGALEASS